ncbi:uncharacterized protein F4812DRAFT_437348 [Daldinia caldariorum]|uniref:uncharacterized protein n=1 Tax=Daldinia caldariorum TaxID=326644 RepID=UPI00200817CB|nr:uncharacterized protein F4812DRAFT_437348 [Daldinia caldariorum]KAI1465733.1 hypothetical protein F4812DRAFT_437348 [Daldinia caldariorum]
MSARVVPSRILDDMDLKCDSCFRHVPAETLHKTNCGHSYCVACAQDIFLTTIHYRQRPYCCGELMFKAPQYHAIFSDEFCYRYRVLFLEARAERNAAPGHPSVTCRQCIRDGNVTQHPPDEDGRPAEKRDWRELRARGGIIIDGKSYPRTCPCGARICIECGKPFNEEDCTCASRGLGCRATNRPVFSVVYLVAD